MGPIIKYEDDLGVIRYPDGSMTLEDGSITYSFPYDRAEALRRIAPLCIPWHPSKGSNFAQEFTYIGFQWNIQDKTVSLPDPKRLKFLGRVNAFIASFSDHRCQLLDVLKIHGSLCHIAFVYPDGRGYLASLSCFGATFKGDKYMFRFPPKSLISDLEWWRRILSIPAIFRSLVPRGPPYTYIITSMRQPLTV